MGGREKGGGGGGGMSERWERELVPDGREGGERETAPRTKANLFTLRSGSLSHTPTEALQACTLTPELPQTHTTSYHIKRQGE